MRILLDTCIFISIIEGDIDDVANKYFHDYDNQIYISSESVKEFMHFAQNGKIKFQRGLNDKTFDVFGFIEDELGIEVKYVHKEHLKHFAQLGRVENHNDPSDRLIIAQTIAETLTLISSDHYFPKYRKQGLEFIKV